MEINDRVMFRVNPIAFHHFFGPSFGVIFLLGAVEYPHNPPDPGDVLSGWSPTGNVLLHKSVECQPNDGIVPYIDSRHSVSTPHTEQL